MARGYVKNLLSHLLAYDEKRKAIDARNKKRSAGAKVLDAPAPSEVNFVKVAKKRLQEEKDREKRKADKKVEDRKVQLAKMPRDRGMPELNRLNKGGSLTESKAEKSARQRKEQLAAMPKDRGKVPDKKHVDKRAAAREEVNKAKRGLAETKPKKKSGSKNDKVDKLMKGLA